MKILRWTQLTILVLLIAIHAFGAPVAHYTFDDPVDRYNDISNGYNGSVDGSGMSFVSSGITGLGDAMNSTTAGRVLVNPVIPISLSDFTILFWGRLE